MEIKENTTVQNLWDAAKSSSKREVCINTSLNQKQEKSQTPNLTSKKSIERTKLKANRRKY